MWLWMKRLSNAASPICDGFCTMNWAIRENDVTAKNKLKYLLHVSSGGSINTSHLNCSGLGTCGIGLVVNIQNQRLSGTQPFGLQGWQLRNIPIPAAPVAIPISQYPITNSPEPLRPVNSEPLSQRCLHYLVPRPQGAPMTVNSLL